MSRGISRIVAALAAGIVILGTTQVLAQEPDKTRQEEEEKNRTLMGEILVTTARHVEERLQDVPISITAFGEEQIESAGISNLQDIAAMTPGLSFYNPVGQSLPTPIIRGVAPTDIRGQNNAAVFLDGVFVSGREGLDFGELDIKDISVLKGPQSAQYGRNAFSGAINFVTNDPTPDFQSKADATVGNGNRYGIRGIVSGPLIGTTLLGRLAVSFDEWDGSYNNPIPGGPDVGGYRYRTVLGKLLWNATDNLKFLASGYYSNDHVDDSATVAYPATCENSPYPTTPTSQPRPPDYRLQNICGTLPTLASNDIPRVIGATGEERSLLRGSLRVDWTLPYGSIDSLTAYFYTAQDARVDANFGLGYNLPFVYTNSPNCSLFAQDPSGNPTAPAYALFTCPYPGNPQNFGRIFTGLIEEVQPDVTKEISEELRFVSPQDRPLRYQSGIYLYLNKQHSRNTGLVATNQTLADNQRLGFFAPVTGTTALTVGDAIFRPWFVLPSGDADPRIISLQDTSAWAAFGSLDWDFLEKFTLGMEARYTSERQSVTSISYTDPVYGDHSSLGSLPDKQCPLPQNPAAIIEQPGSPNYPTCPETSHTWGFWSGKVSLNYKITPDWTTYVSLSRGVKSGAFQIPSPPPNILNGEQGRITIARTDEETILATEVGVKGNGYDGRVSLEFAAFWNDWRNVVIPEIFTVDPNHPGDAYTQPLALNQNAGNARVLGTELSVKARPIENWTTGFSVAYTNAVWLKAIIQSYATFAGNAGLPPGVVTSGQATGFCASPVGTTAGNLAPNCGDVSGNALLRQPPWTVNAWLEYSRPVWGDWTYFTRGDMEFEDQWFVGNENEAVVPSHTYFNLRLGLKSARYSIELWAKNLMNEHEPIGAFRQPFFGNTDQVLPPYANATRSTGGSIFPWALVTAEPDLRTFGVTFRARFGSAER